MRSRVEALEEEVARLRAQVGGASVGAQTPQPAEAQADIKTAEAQTDGGQTAETAPVEESADKESAAEPPVGNGEQANAAEPPSIHADTFEGVRPNACQVHVPAGCGEAYRQAQYWNNFPHIEETSAGGAGS